VYPQASARHKISLRKLGPFEEKKGLAGALSASVGPIEPQWRHSQDYVKPSAEFRPVVPIPCGRWLLPPPPFPSR